jgi:hypothetical protein
MLFHATPRLTPFSPRRHTRHAIFACRAFMPTFSCSLISLMPPIRRFDSSSLAAIARLRHFSFISCAIAAAAIFISFADYADIAAIDFRFADCFSLLIFSDTLSPSFITLITFHFSLRRQLDYFLRHYFRHYHSLFHAADADSLRFHYFRRFSRQIT